VPLLLIAFDCPTLPLAAARLEAPALLRFAGGIAVGRCIVAD
jgi:hypothetical protein